MSDTALLPRCPGIYCGYDMSLDPPECSACPRGHRSDGTFCLPCTEGVDAYAICFLATTVLIVAALHLYGLLDTSGLPASVAAESNMPKRRAQTLLLIGCGLELTLAVVLSLLVTLPLGSMSMVSCGMTRLSDWYPALHNPTSPHLGLLRCANEAAYPLVTWVLFFDLFSAALVLMIRWPLLRYIGRNLGAYHRLSPKCESSLTVGRLLVIIL